MTLDLILVNRLQISHEIEKYKRLTDGDNKHLSEQSEQFFLLFVHVSKENLSSSGIPEECLEDVEDKDVTNRYDIVAKMVAYFREQVANKRSQCMTKVALKFSGTNIAIIIFMDVIFCSQDVMIFNSYI